MAPLSKLSIAFKALTQLGFEPVALNALYRFGLVTGHYRRVEKKNLGIGNGKWEGTIPHSLFTFPSREQLTQIIGQDGLQILLTEADEIVAGKVRLFGGEPVELKLTVPEKLEHWTAYETGKAPSPINHLPFPDIKFLWEPARFGWAFTLGYAYHLTRDEKYAEAFWRYFEIFLDANPPYIGPNWTSGQEAALRLMAFVWAGQIFAAASASTPERKARLATSVAAHAARIPPTFIYARSQQNNHLLIEAAGLFTAGLAIPEHPSAIKCRSMGWEWLTRGLQEQIDGYGEYAQHSTNYHRLMLQVVLWTNALVKNDFAEHPHGVGRSYRWPRQTNEAIVRSIHWLLALLDSDSGHVPNLGANDGAYIFPLTTCSFDDYRPVLYTAARAFLGYDLPRGPWDELSLWFGVPLENRKYVQLPRYLGDQLYGKDSWASLRTAQFATRPSHADQLHIDLWWRGLNVAQDAGTYLYNADPPWDNSLTTALVHNTVTANGRDQMTRAGRFLYLDWVNAYRRGGLEADPAILQRARGRYRDYRRGYCHTRLVTVFTDEHWRIEDDLMRLRWLPSSFTRHPSVFRLHWLLPDWEWEIENSELGMVLRLASPYGPVALTIHYSPLTIHSAISLARAGELLTGSASPDPIRGWVSPTYGVKVPALSLAIETRSADDVQFVSEFVFP
jgi:hypothetical protein